MKYLVYKGKTLVGEAVRFSDGKYSVMVYGDRLTHEMTDADFKRKRWRVEPEKK